MSNRIAVVCEAAGDFEVARELIDQTVMRCVDHIEESVIDSFCTYTGPSVNEPFVVWNSLNTAEEKDYRVAIRGRFANEWPGNDIALRVRRAIFDCLRRAPDAYIVIVKDTDNEPARYDELRQAAALVEKMPVVLGIQHTELECWLVAGFEPVEDDETQRLAELCRGEFPPGVGFNPSEKSHQLTATKRDHEKLSPKRVLKHLCGGDRSRELKGLHRDNHATLKRRGTENGLADFLRDIERRLVFSVFGVTCS